MRVSRLRVCVTQHILPSPALQNPSTSDLIGQENDIYTRQKATKCFPSHSFTQPTPIRSQATQYSSLVPTYTPFYVPKLPQPRLRPCRPKPGHRQAPEAVCLTLSKPNGHSLLRTRIAEHQRVAEGSQSVSRETSSARPSHSGTRVARFEAARHMPLP